jgi:thymidylate synthase
MVAELLWYLSANNKTAWIAKYSAFWNDISDDGHTANSAYGARLFVPHEKIANGRFTQWQYVLNELRRDNDSRRAVMHLRVPADSIDARLDVPCTLSLQFFIRNKKLHMIVNMRSSDLIFGIAYDIPAFTLFQEILANQLNVELGTYTHMSNSLHIYERHFDMVEKILRNQDPSLKMAAQYGPMPPLDKLGATQPALEHWIERLMMFEHALYEVDEVRDVYQLWTMYFSHAVGGNQMWGDWARVLGAQRIKKMGYPESANEFQLLASFNGYCFNTRRK